MKIAHLLRKYNAAEWGGTETALAGLCGGLRQQAVESVVYAPAVDAAATDDPLAARGAQVKRFKASVPIWGISPEQRRQMTSIGGNLMSFGLLGKLWREPGLAAIHTHTTGRIGAIGRMIARARGLPLIVTLHGGVYDLPQVLENRYVASSRGWEWGKVCGLALRSRHLLSDADAIMTGNATAAALIRARHPRQRVLIHSHGIECQRYAVDRRAAAWKAFPQTLGREVLLCVGRIDPAKNQSWLLEQLPELVMRHPRLLLVLAGAETDYQMVKALNHRIDQLGLHNHVLMTGGLPSADDRLIGLMQLARAAVLPSLAETFGLVIVEAWAAGTPIIASRTAGACGLIDQMKTGRLFDLSEPQDFHSAVDRLWSDFAHRRELIAAGRQRALSFDTEFLARQMARVYEELIEEKRTESVRNGAVGRRFSAQPQALGVEDVRAALWE